MRFGKSAERHAEQIRCKGCNRNMFLSVHNKAVIDLIRKNNQMVFSCQINDLLKYLFWIKSTGRVIRIDEHVNDHQVEFARNVAQRMGTIIPVEDISKLGDVIKNYDEIVAKMGHGMSSNNEKFCKELENIVNGMLK